MWSFFIALSLFAETRIQILHTSDIHSHFINDSSPLKLGGVARLKSQILQLQEKNENHLLLDAGDWTEGSIFFVLNSGEKNHELMESMGFDAIVFGNHDWLAGPKEVYEAFQAANMQVPVLGANIDFAKMPAEYPIQKYIHPYHIKMIDGKKVGIIGLSTFEIVFDQFLEPAELESPLKHIVKYTRILKEEEKCDVIIALTHIGIEQDKMIAQAAPDLDLIVGGHSHILLKKPVYENGVPIVHIGKWGWYLGEYELFIDDDGNVSLTNHKIHQIDETLPEDIETKMMVEGYQSLLRAKWGPIWSDKKAFSDVNLPGSGGQFEYKIANIAADAMRHMQRADIALDDMSYQTQDMYKGWLHTADFFNLYPHNWSTTKDRAWSVTSFEIKGYLLKFLMNTFLMKGAGLAVSNAELEIDLDSKLKPLKSVKIGRKNLENGKSYKVAASEGVMDALNYVQSMGWNLHLRRKRNSNREVWRVVQEKVESLSPIEREDVEWEGRIRTKQADLGILEETVMLRPSSNGENQVVAELVNIGKRTAHLTSVELKLDITPENTLDNQFYVKKLDVDVKIKRGRSYHIAIGVPSVLFKERVYPFELEFVSDDSNIRNNYMRSYLYNEEEWLVRKKPIDVINELWSKSEFTEKD